MITYKVTVEDNGTEKWFLNGQFHRENGPAFTSPDGTKHWARNGEFHREDGPAIVGGCRDGQYWLNGVMLSEKEFLRKTSPEPQIISDFREVAEKHGYTLERK